MRTKVSSITLLTAMISVLLCNIPSVQASYNPQAAVDYAKEWDCEGCRNTDDYLVYDADCANFVSQCLIAGGLDLTACTDPEVVTDEKGCIISCKVLDRYLRWVGVNHDCNLVNEGEPEWLRAGDVIILACSPDRYQHAMIVANGEGPKALYSGHSQDQEEVDFSELPKLLWDKYANDYCETTHINYYQIVQGQPVYFADANLKYAVEQALGKSNPTQTDMLGLHYLNACCKGISDLTGLNYALNMDTLILYNNQISDISPLLEMKHMQILHLENNIIGHLPPLSGLTNLSWLWLSGNNISDILPLSGLTNLSDLRIGGNQISDFSSLSGLMNLTSLSIRGSEISDISTLSGLIHLTILDLCDNEIMDLSPLSDLTKLVNLYLQHNQISDLSRLSGLKNIQTLWLDSNKISDVSPLPGLTQLYILSLVNNNISDISSLVSLRMKAVFDFSMLDLRFNPLNQDAYDIYIPKIRENNPGIRLYYDPPISPDRIIAAVYSPVELRVYDSQGQITGLLDGEEKNEIPNSTYFENTVTIFFPTDTYYYEVEGTGQGTYGLNITSVSGGESVAFEAADIPTSPGARHVYAVDWQALSVGEEGVILEIDNNGDGFFEQMAIADNELSYDEFALQTETVVDFDPDTLNLKSKGKFVTVYIELPEDFDVSEIDLFSLELNELVPPLPKPIEIGDYDSDGINDLMVKFDRQELIEVLEPGKEQIVDLTGRLSDGRPIAGFDIIRVIDKGKNKESKGKNKK